MERSPWWGGFYERLVAIVKNSLKKGVLTSKLSLDELQTVIIEIGNVINSRPLTYLEDQPYENLTPYHLIYGRNLASKPTDKEIKEFSSGDYIKSCKKLKANISYFENRFKNEYLTALQERHTYLNKCKNNSVEEILRIGDIVLLKEDNKPRLSWRKGKIEAFFVGKDNVTRGVKISVYQNKLQKTVTLKHPLQLIVPLEVTYILHENSLQEMTEPTQTQREAAANADVIRKLMT